MANEGTDSGGERRTAVEAFSDAQRGTPPIALDWLGKLRKRAEQQTEKHRALHERYEGSMPPPEWIWELDAAVEKLQRDGAEQAIAYKGFADSDWKAEELKLEGAINTLGNLQKQAHELTSQKESDVYYGGIKARSEAERILEEAERESERT